MLAWKRNDEYRTPPETVTKLERDLNIKFNGFDPAPMPRPDGFDGLDVSWGEAGEWVFVNPPFTQVKEFTEKAFVELGKGVNSCLLMPARMENKLWQNLIIPYASQVRIIPAGYRFLNPDESDTRRKAPQTLAIVLVSKRMFCNRLTTWDWRK